MRKRPVPVPDNRVITLAELMTALSRLAKNLRAAGYLEEADDVDELRQRVRLRASQPYR